MSTVTLHIGDVFDRLADIPDGSVDLIVTSPPFLALRSYLPADHPDKHREIGSEATPAAFLDTLLQLTAEWRRVLAPHGSLCVELGDTYSGSGGAGGDYSDDGLRAEQPKFDGSAHRTRASGTRTTEESRLGVDARNRARRGGNATTVRDNPGAWPLAKSLTGIPHSYELSLIYGWNVLDRHADDSPAGRWRIRNLLVWARPNPPVGALGDKFRPACSYITVACTGPRRWFDLDGVRTEAKIQMGRAVDGNNVKGGDASSFRFAQRVDSNPAGAPPLDWHDDDDDGPTGDRLWQMATAPYKGAHYATYPLELPLRLIKAMCPQRVCLTCGQPSVRITGEPRYESTNGGRVVNQWAGERRSQNTNQWTVEGGNPGHAVKVQETLGWSDCGHNNYRPGIVLDPFLGSGTTAVAAALTGRDSIGIDLDPRNTGLVHQRLGERLHITSRVGFPGAPNHVWHCDAPLPDQREQTEGQTNLLDLLEAP